MRSLNILNINLPEISNHHFYINPSWFQIDLITNINFRKITSKEINSTIADTIYLDNVNICYLDNIRIFTDGSKQADGTFGLAMLIELLNLTFSWRLVSNHSALAAELFAIHISLNWIKENTNFQNFVIFGDSMFLLK